MAAKATRNTGNTSTLPLPTGAPATGSTSILPTEGGSAAAAGGVLVAAAGAAAGAGVDAAGGSAGGAAAAAVPVPVSTRPRLGLNTPRRMGLGDWRFNAARSVTVRVDSDGGLMVGRPLKSSADTGGDDSADLPESHKAEHTEGGMVWAKFDPGLGLTECGAAALLAAAGFTVNTASASAAAAAAAAAEQAAQSVKARTATLCKAAGAIALLPDAACIVEGARLVKAALLGADAPKGDALDAAPLPAGVTADASIRKSLARALKACAATPDKAASINKAAGVLGLSLV